MQFHERYSYTFGVKVEETQLRVALTDLQAEILDVKTVPFEAGSKPEKAVELLSAAIQVMRQAHGLAERQIAGIGIAASGLINRETGTILRSSLLGWENVSICKEVSKRLNGMPVYLDKNINAYTLAELTLGSKEKQRHVVIMSIGAGLGLTIVIDGSMYYGSFGGAGEFGHTIVQMNGYRCHCGQRGCLEMYASEFYLQHAGGELRRQYPHTAVERYTFSGMEQALKQGDELAARLLREMGTHIGYGLVNVINTLNPKRIVLTGEGMNYAPHFLPYALKVAEENFFAAAALPTEIVVSQLGNDAWLQGAALLVIEQLFQLPIYQN
nr:ROK family protein [Ectobacillus ponti]